MYESVCVSASCNQTTNTNSFLLPNMASVDVLQVSGISKFLDLVGLGFNKIIQHLVFDGLHNVNSHLYQTFVA